MLSGRMNPFDPHQVWRGKCTDDPRMVAGLIQIASFVPLKATGTAAGNPSLRSATDLHTTFQQHMRNELGRSAEDAIPRERSTGGAQKSRNSRDTKPAKEQGANSWPVRNAASDEPAVPPKLRNFSSPSPADSGLSPGLAQLGTFASSPNSQSIAGDPSALAAHADPRSAAISEAALSSESNVAENNAAEDNAGRSRIPIAADAPDGARSSRASSIFDAGAGRYAVKDISASSPQPLQSVQEEQPPTLAESKSVTRDDPADLGGDRQRTTRDGRGDEADPGYASAGLVPPSATSPSQPDATPEPDSPQGEAQESAGIFGTAAEGAGLIHLADAVPVASQVLATGNLGDAFEKLVNAAPGGRQAPSNENLERKKDPAGAHDVASESHGTKAAAAPERKASDAGAAKVSDPAVTTPTREPAPPARSSDQLAAPSFNQAFTSERTKPPIAEPNAPEQGASTAALAPAPEPSDGPNPLQMHSARLTGNENQAEVQVALQTADYGHVEIKTTLQNSTLGATIAVEHSNLREQIVSALPELRHSFAERQITLESLTVSDSLSSATSFTNSHQQRSNQQQAAVPYPGSQERRAASEWETTSGKLPEPVLQPWAGDSGSKLNVLV